MKKFSPILAVALLLIFCFSKLHAQNNVSISGGNLTSSALCGGTGQVYTWGKGVGGTPKLVTFPVSPATGLPVTIAQVSSGSGGHFIALDCDGHVWTWGGNSNGQAGCTNLGGTVTTPVMITAGATPGTYLSNVTSVAGGNNSSFAVLSSGELVAWGQNTESELGDGTKMDKCSPVYVLKNGTTAHLTGVQQVLAGDVTGYALVNDATGSGTVYSWGSTGGAYSGNVLTVVANGLLGRLLAGGYAAPGVALELGTDPYARPVYMGPGQVLTNVSNIGAGDVFGMALDISGYIWAWGHDAWSGTTGTGTNCSNTDFAYPKRVKAGAAAGTNDDDGSGYLLASSIAAGQGFAMAVTLIDQKPMSWGNNACGNSASGGGCLGNPATTACNPVYILPCGGGGAHSDVTHIYRGDTWGFYTREDGSLWTWGTNDVGQLGLGTTSTTGQSCATKLSTLPCAPIDPKPTANLTPGNDSVCAQGTISVLLNSGFNIGSALLPSYTITWYKNGGLIAGASGLTYTATTVGKYKVKIAYTGTNGPCHGWPYAADSMNIYPYPQDFSDPGTNTYCGNTATVNVKSTSPRNPQYDWYTTSTPTGLLGHSIGNGSTTINVSGVTTVAGTPNTKTVYVEESKYASGTVLPAAPCAGSSANSNLNSYYVQLTVYDDIVIDSVDVIPCNQNGSVSTASTWQASVFPGVLNNNGVYVPSTTGEKNGATSPPIGGGIPANSCGVVTSIPVKITLTGSANGSVYFLRIKSGGHFTYFNCPATYPIADNVVGSKIVEFGSTNEFGNPVTTAYHAPFYNMQFTTLNQKYCAILPIVLKESCPCNKPTSVTIASTPTAVAGTPKSITICANANPYPTLSGTYKAGAGTNTNNYNYVWFKKGTTVKSTDYHDSGTKIDGTAGPTGIPSLTVPADSGIWYLRVEDFNGSPNPSCFKQDSIHLIVNKLPVITARDTGVCAPNSVNITKKWTDANTTGGTASYYSGTSASGTLLNNAQATAVTTSGPYYVQVVNGLCTAGDGLTVTINNGPGKPILSGDSMLCPGQRLAFRATTGGSGTLRKFFWTFPSGSKADTSDTKPTPPFLNDSLVHHSGMVAADAGLYKVVSVSTNGCRDSVGLKVQLAPLPAKPTLAGATLCEGSALTLTASNPSGATVSNYVWHIPATSTATAGGTKNSVMSKASVAPADSGTYVATAVTSEGCRDSSSAKVGVYAKPKVPVISTNGGADITMCGSSQQLAVDPASYTVGKVQWKDDKSLTYSDAGGSTRADTLLTTTANGFTATTGTASFTVTVTNGTCPAVSDAIKVTRSGALTDPGLTGLKTVCINGSVTFTGNAANVTGNQETSRWSWTPTANVAVDSGGTAANSNKAKFTFTKAGSYDLTYHIDNPTCPEKSETATVVVTDSAHAQITSPAVATSPGSNGFTFSTNPQAVTSADPGTGYAGTWAVSKTSGTGTPLLTGPSLNALTNAVDSMHYDDVSKVTWTVRDNGSVCPAAVATLNLTRKNITPAKAKNDTICITAGSAGYTQTPPAANQPNSTETAKWTADPGSPAATTAADGYTLNVTLNLAGTYGYTYTITSKTVMSGGVLISSSAHMTVIVEDVASTPDADTRAAAGATVQVCSTPFPLSASAPNTAVGERGGWKGTGVTFTPDTSSNTAKISGLTDGQSYTLTWSIYTKYGKCPSKSDQITYQKLKDITPATVDSVGDFCVGTTGVNLKATKAANGNNETGTWTSTPPGLIPAGDLHNETPATITNLTKGTYTMKWTITSTTCPGGNSDSTTFKVDSLPSVASITAQNPNCELDPNNLAGQPGRGTYTANGVSPKFSFPVHLKWTTTSQSAGNPTRTFIGTDTLPAATITFTSKDNYRESKDSATVVLTVSNQCGNVSISTPVIYRLRPRLVDTINTGAICGSATGHYAFGTKAQSNADTYEWMFGTKSLPNIPYPTSDSVYVYPSDWAGQGSSATLTVTLKNTCGAGADTFTVVPIITPAALTVTLSSDKDAGFCVPQDALLFTAKAVTTPTLPGGLIVSGTYTFYKNSTTAGNEIGSPTTAYPALLSTPKGTFVDGDVVFVKFHADTGQCLTNPADTAKDALNGYVYPDATIHAGDTVVCENPTGVTLSVVKDPKNGKGIDWYKSGVLLPQYKDSYSINPKTPSESGRYIAVVHANVCVYDAYDDSVKVRIYDRPDPYFAGPDPLLIYYDANSPGIKMPFGGTGTVDSVYRIGDYYDQNPYGWLSTLDSLAPTIKTTMDEVPVTYTVTMYTGDPTKNVNCKGSKDFTVMNTLPLKIPNAFSPNGDNKNDKWVIDGLGKYPNTHVKVYNRWGSAMFTNSDGYKEAWDGTAHGAELPSGTYYYIVDLKGSPDGTDGQRSGSLTIVK